MKHCFLSVFLAGTLLVATSCIDNDEPQGLQEMRKAKAELMQASAAVQLAEAELRKAEAVAKEAEARITTAQAEALEIANAIQSARNDAEKEELKLKLERLAEQQKADLQQLMAATAKWEAEYQKALIDLEGTLATYRNSKYAGELKTVLGELKTVRGTITTLRGQIVDKQAELIAYITRDSLTANRRIRTAVTTAQKNYDLGVEKAALLREAKEGSTGQWGQTRDEMTARMEALKTEWTEYAPQLIQLQDKNTELNRRFFEQRYLIDGDYSSYANGVTGLGLEPNPNLNPMQTVTITVPASLQELFEKQIVPNYRNVKKNELVYTLESAGIEAALRIFRYAYDPGTDAYYYEDFPDGLSASGMIPTIETWILSDNDIAYADRLKTQFEAKSAAAKTLYETQIDIYKKLRTKYIAAAEAYGCDWTQVNNSVDRHLWFTTYGLVSNFYYEYDRKAAEDPQYAPSAAELKTVAAQIANYLRKRVDLTSEYWLDPLVVVDPLKPQERMRLSAALTAAGAEADSYRLEYLITSGDGRTVMGNYENLTWNVSGAQNPDGSKYDNLIGDIATYIGYIYGLQYGSNGQIPLILIDLDPTNDLTVGNSQFITDYTKINPGNYTVNLNTPIKNLPYTAAGSTGLVQSLDNLTQGSLYVFLTIQAATDDLAALIASQADIRTLIDGAEKSRTTLLTAYKTAAAIQEALNDEYRKSFEAYSDFIYNHRLELDANGQITSTNLSLVEQEYRYCKQMHDLLEGYIDKAEITLSDGSNYNVYSDIDAAIEQAEKDIDPTTPNGLYEKLEQAKANLAAWETLGYDGVAAGIGDQIRAEIADMQADLAEAEAEFERCSELKDRLIDLMKAE